MLALLIGTSVSPRWLFVEPATNEPELIARSPPGRKVGEPSAPHSVAVLALAGDSRP